MRNKILAKIPADIGKKLYCGGDVVVTVEAERCDQCDAKATQVIQGETDSFGYEPIFLCDACATRCQDAQDTWIDALDVEDRQGFFYVSEMTNYDGHGDWDKAFTSYRSAVSFLREIEERAAPWGGLYPGKGVRELATKEEYDALLARWKKIEEQERREREEEARRQREEYYDDYEDD